MTFQVLLSTMHQENYSILSEINLKSNAIVVNQCNIDSIENIRFNDIEVLWINTTDRGLSKSRNLALSYASADICLITDDDIILCDNIENTVIDCFKKNSNYDVLGFQVYGIEKKFKQYSSKEYNVDFFKSLKMASVELAFKKESLIKNAIKFDELIGAGTKFLMGEENALLAQCIRKKLLIHYYPYKIADLHIGNSTWFKEYDEKYFIGKGAAFAAMDTNFTNFLIIFWLLRKKRIVCNNISFFKALSLLLNGKKEYLLLRKKNGKK